MRAVQVHEFGPPSSLVLAEVPEPAAGPGEVVVEVEAAGVNFPDVLVVEGTYQNLPARPFSPGTEAAGTVVAVGEGVQRVAVGQRVLALVEHGAFTERLQVHEDLVVAVPDEISFEEAAAFGLVYHTAHFGLVRRARVQPGEWVLITGAGGAVGSAALQLAKVLGANVVALVRDPEHAEMARARGADVVLVADVETLRDDLLWATGGHGVDVTLDVVGGDVFSQVVRATAWEGRVVIAGFASGGQNPIKPGHLLVKNIAVMGVQSSDYLQRTPELFRSTMREMLQLHAEGKLSAPLDKTFPLSKAGDALQAVKDGLVRGKAVVVPERDRDQRAR